VFSFEVKVICLYSISYTNFKEAEPYLQTSNQKLKRGATEIAAKKLCLICLNPHGLFPSFAE
jgi:hypothetical protein